jgi:hypothetical protein
MPARPPTITPLILPACQESVDGGETVEEFVEEFELVKADTDVWTTVDE